MELLSKEILDFLENHKWTLRYDRETHSAKMINEHGEEMNQAALMYTVDALNNRYEDLFDDPDQYDTRPEPLDEVTRKRLNLHDYQLISHQHDGETTLSVFEIYSDNFKMFTLDCYDVYKNRKIYDDGFLAFLNVSECKKLLQSLRAFVKRCEAK